MGLEYLLPLYLDLQLMVLSDRILPQMVPLFSCFSISNAYKRVKTSFKNYVESISAIVAAESLFN